LVQHDGEEIKHGFNPSNFEHKDQENLRLQETNERPHLKDAITFALLIVVFCHTITIFNELDNLLRLGMILNRKTIGLRNHVGQQHNSNIGESSNKTGSRL
jgi:hypothetical protein